MEELKEKSLEGSETSEAETKPIIEKEKEGSFVDYWVCYLRHRDTGHPLTSFSEFSAMQID